MITKKKVCSYLNKYFLKMQINFTSDKTIISSYNMIRNFIKKYRRITSYMVTLLWYGISWEKKGVAVLRQYKTFSYHCNSVMYYLALHPSTIPQWELCIDLEMKRQTETYLIVLITVLYSLCCWVYVLKCVFNSQTDIVEISIFINNQKSRQIYKYIATFLNLLYLRVSMLQSLCV